MESGSLGSYGNMCRPFIMQNVGGILHMYVCSLDHIDTPLNTYYLFPGATRLYTLRCLVQVPHGRMGRVSTLVPEMKN